MNIKRAELFGRSMGKRAATVKAAEDDYLTTYDRLSTAINNKPGSPNNPLKTTPGYFPSSTPYSSPATRAGLAAGYTTGHSAVRDGFVNERPGVPTFRLPSGATQTGTVLQSSGDWTDPRVSTRPAIPNSPGIDSGPSVHRFSMHGGDRPYSGSDAYGLLNPGQKGFSPILDLPKGHNPSTVISEACNRGQCGNPAVYAGWYNSNLKKDRVSGDPTPALNLNKVVMTPTGYAGQGSSSYPILNKLPMLGSGSSPYVTDLLAPIDSHIKGAPGSSMHEYRLAKGGNPLNKGHWTDTGVYTDARQSIPVNPFALYGEAKEMARHMGLSKDLGGGDFNSYLDKVRAINQNPDASLLQKAYSNYARPVGSAAEMGRALGSIAKQTPGIVANEAKEILKTPTSRIGGQPVMPARGYMPYRR